MDMTLTLEVVSEYCAICRNLTIFQIESHVFQIESLHLKSNGVNHDLYSSCDWDLPITGVCQEKRVFCPEVYV